MKKEESKIWDMLNAPDKYYRLAIKILVPASIICTLTNVIAVVVRLFA